MSSSSSSETFQPVLVGTSPAGVEYVAYKASDVERLKRSLARAWDTHTRRVEKLSAGVMHAVEFQLLNIAERGDCTEKQARQLEKVRVGRSFIVAPNWVLQECADAVEDAAELLECGQGGMAETSTLDVSWEFAEACDARRAKSMRRHARRLRGQRVYR